ncbi:MAG: response regulator [Candidatus Omnitrophica bacterium]|nr:response regulator [Candidatus Omnitrophota bacterium]
MEKKTKILVVDDEVDLLEILTKRLQANNYEVITARDGADALEKFSKEKPDAILLDIMMPRIDGIDVLRRIRKENANIPIFMITAFSNEERFKLANTLNASGFIMKTDDLQAQIKNITAAISIAAKYKK